jgi:hypothetical protein
LLESRHYQWRVLKVVAGQKELGDLAQQQDSNGSDGESADRTKDHEPPCRDRLTRPAQA